MPTSLVTYAADGRVGIVSLNRPDKLNAISADLKRALVERFHEADRDSATSVVVLRAEGRSFCAGYDIAPNPARTERRGGPLARHHGRTDSRRLGFEARGTRKTWSPAPRGPSPVDGTEA